MSDGASDALAGVRGGRGDDRPRGPAAGPWILAQVDHSPVWPARPAVRPSPGGARRSSWPCVLGPSPRPCSAHYGQGGRRCATPASISAGTAAVSTDSAAFRRGASKSTRLDPSRRRVSEAMRSASTFDHALTPRQRGMTPVQRAVAGRHRAGRFPAILNALAVGGACGRRRSGVWPMLNMARPSRPDRDECQPGAGPRPAARQPGSPEDSPVARDDRTGAAQHGRQRLRLATSRSTRPASVAETVNDPRSRRWSTVADQRHGDSCRSGRSPRKMRPNSWSYRNGRAVGHGDGWRCWPMR